MRRVLNLLSSTIGQKLLVAVTGLALVGFVIAHLAGNLKLYQGAQKFDGYAHWLREVGAPVFGHGELLWIARIGLLLVVLLHMLTVLQLVRRSRQARDVGYRRVEDQSMSYASRTMRWGGVIIVSFVVYHLLHLTLGTVHPDFDRNSPYANVISGFQVWWVVPVYAVAILALGFHIYHGLWSATQTLAIRLPWVQRMRRPVAAGIAGAIVIGYLSIPISVLTGLLK